MRGGTTALLVLVLLTPAAAGGQRVSIESAIDSLVQRELGARPIAGMAVGVVRGEDTLFLRSYGTANLEHRVPLDVDGVFQIASLTKQFTAAAALRLVEDGRLGLDDDVRRYLPELDTHGAVVRIRHLLNHTSGVPNIYEMSAWPRIRPLRVPRSDVQAMELSGVAEDSLDFAPGSDFHYSNTGYHFLGDVIESVTGETVESWFTRTLFEPAGLERTGFCPWTRIVPDRVPGYEPDSTGQDLENAWRQSQTVLFTSGAICSTARDLLRWNAALHGGSILGEESYRAMTTPEGVTNSYGYGLFVDSVEGHRRFQHNGYTPGYSSQLEYYPDDDLTVVVLANSPAAVGGLAEAVGRVALGLPARKVPVRPEGWIVQSLGRGADTTTIHFRPMGAGMHVTAGPGAVYFHPDSVATGSYELTAEFTATGGPADTDIGLVFGGTMSDGSIETYTAVLVRNTGQYAVVRHTASRDTLLVAWKESAAVATGGTNRLSVSVDGGGVRLRINDVLVESIPSGEPGHTDGVFGLRLGADADVHVSGFGRGVTDTRGAAKRHAPTPGGTGLEQITVQDRSALARAGASDRSTPPGHSAAPSLLFIGNSYTYYNNLPEVVVVIAGGAGCSVTASRVTIPGGTLAQHWGAGVAADSIRNGDPDFVVVQEQSLLGGPRIDGEPVVGRPDTFFHYTRRFEEEIDRAGATMVLFQTWARPDEPEDQTSLDHAYFTIARELGAVVAPVGVAWSALRESQPGLDLYQADRSHPSPAGTYLAATVIAATVCGELEGEPPTTVAVDSIDSRGQLVAGVRTELTLSPAQAAAVRAAAMQAVDEVRAAGGYLTIPQPRPVPLPRPPTSGKAPRQGELAGTWSGDMRLNVPAP